MVLPHGKITDEGLAELRARIGTYNRPSFYGVGQFNEYAGRDAIRHFAQGIGDLNPLWLDEEYARKTKYGSIVAPPCFLYSVYWSSGRVGGLPGVHGFHSGSDWDFRKTIYVNDRITVKEKFVDLVEKESKFARRTVILYCRTHYRNQRGEVIAVTKGWSVKAERGAAREAGKYSGIEAARYTPEELQAIEEEVLAEEVRGANPRFWEDVNVGDELKPVVKGPLSHGDLIAFAAGALGGLAHGAALREYRKHPAWMYRDPKTGATEAIARVHDQTEAAQGIAIPGAYDFGCQRLSWLGHLMTNWIGDDGFLKVLYGELRRFNVVGDTQWCKGKVTRKYIEDGEHLVDMDIWAMNQRHEITAPGHGTAVLPSKTDGM
ncbi:MAG: MaoC family dehydratase N-terminal domain-containing protein [Chloroflexi bacterium]|nr:MaoC family dehydratase N-terminal domain-containing protein [Chloroflexota bacterium]